MFVCKGLHYKRLLQKVTLSKLRISLLKGLFFWPSGGGQSNRTTIAERWPGGSWLRRRLEEKPDPAMKAQAVRARTVRILLWWPYLETLILLVILKFASQQQVF